MDISAASLLACGLAYRWTSPGSDSSDLSSLSSPETLSPLGYLDSSFSPCSSSDPQPPQSRHSAQGPAGRHAGAGPRSLGSGSPPSCSSSSSRSVRRPARRGRVRSKQRESASEKEKMRMRDLTKALHHLRSYLPASVAPAGQTLTKIETLRLTISYIAHLSAQLGPGQEALFEGSPPSEASPGEEASSTDTLRYFQSLCSSAAAQWGDQQAPGQGQGQGQGQYLSQIPVQAAAAVHPGNCSYGIDVHGYNGGQYGGQCTAAPQGGVFATDMEISLLSPTATHHSHCQMSGPLVAREYWG